MNVPCACLDECIGQVLCHVLCGAVCDWCFKNNCNMCPCCQCDKERCQWCNRHCDNACLRLEQSFQTCNCSRALEYCFCLPFCDYVCDRCAQNNCCDHCLHSDCCFPDESEPKFVTSRPIHSNYETMSNRSESDLVTIQPTNSRLHVNYDTMSNRGDSGSVTIQPTNSRLHATSNRKDGTLYPSSSTASNLMILSADALEENYETLKKEEQRQQSNIGQIITTKEDIFSEDQRNSDNSMINMHIDNRRNGDSSNSMTNTHNIDNRTDAEEEQNQNFLIKSEYKQTTVYDNSHNCLTQRKN